MRTREKLIKTRLGMLALAVELQNIGLVLLRYVRFGRYGREPEDTRLRLRFCGF